MHQVCATLLVLFAFISDGKEINSESENTTLQLKMIVKTAADGMGIYPVPHIVMTDDILIGDETIPMSIYQIPVMPDSFAVSPRYVIRVRNTYIKDHPAGGIEHGVTHEICHAKLGHLDRRNRDEIEFEAERCAYYFLGEDIYVAFLMSHARWNVKKTGTYKELITLDESDFRKLLRKAFRITGQ